MTDVTYELCFDPRDATVLVYRSVRAGVCGPCSSTLPCESREQAEAYAVSLGYAVVGEWASHRNYDSVDLVR